MDQLDKDAQTAIKKMSNERLVGYLIKAEEDEETVYQLNRQQLMDAWANVILEGRDKPKAAAMAAGAGDTELELQKKRLEFEMMRYQQERAERAQREDEDRQIRLREIKLKEEELSLQRARDNVKKEKLSSLAGRTKFYAEALKQLVHRLPSDPAEIPAFFENLENTFACYEVPEDVKPKILIAHLNDRAKILTARLSREKLDKYEEIKQFLLKEFKISSVQLRDRFYSLRKSNDETYTMLASKLHNALTYYLKSRDITDSFDKLVSLICADRMKELIPKRCLDYILAQEKDSWLEHDELANSIDVYMASHDASGSIVKALNTNSGVSPGLKSPKPQHKYPTAGNETSAEPKPELKPSREEMMKKGLCFNCLERGHTFKTCPKQKNAKADKPTTHVSTCAVAPDVPLLVDPIQDSVPSSCSPSTGCVDDDDVLTDHSFSNGYNPCIDADEFHVRSYVDINIEGLPRQTALIDGGSEICCINEMLIQNLNVPVVKQLHISGLNKQSDLVNVVRLHVGPVSQEKHVVNIAPSVRVWFAVVPSLHESVILTPNVVSLLHDVSHYNVPVPNANVVPTTDDDTVCHELPDNSVHIAHMQADHSVVVDMSVADTHTNVKPDDTQQFFDTENTSHETDDRNVDHSTLVSEQSECPSLTEYWKLAEQNKSVFFVDDGLLYHRDTILGHKVKQLCFTRETYTHSVGDGS